MRNPLRFALFVVLLAGACSREPEPPEPAPKPRAPAARKPGPPRSFDGAQASAVRKGMTPEQVEDLVGGPAEVTVPKGEPRRVPLVKHTYRSGGIDLDVVFGNGRVILVKPRSSVAPRAASADRRDDPPELRAALSLPAGATVRSAGSGRWSNPATWEGSRPPGAGAIVVVRAGHRVVYDVASNSPVRGLHIAGILSFDPDLDTRLCAGLIRIQPGETPSESGFDCAAHAPDADPTVARPALEVGTPDRPIRGDRVAIIRLVHFDGMDPKTLPAIVCCGGRMDFHGAPMARTWIKLERTAASGSDRLKLATAPEGWHVGDRIVVTATDRQQRIDATLAPSVADRPFSEERIIKSIDGGTVALDHPLQFAHRCEADFACEAANLSRNVIVESAHDDRPRGHTMYHRNSAGSISYAEFRRLGKPGVLGKYSLHFHLCGDTLRGSSVIGASIWDSGNRWITVHGTNRLVVRDCVGYRSAGHGFFLEDGTEVFNVFDRCLAIQALNAPKLPGQVLGYDDNDGSGFWWANCLNTFTRCCAVECDGYGWFFQVVAGADFDPVLPVATPQGATRKVDIRTLPFVRFEDNEAHSQRRHAINLGGGVRFDGPGVDGVGPDARSPSVIRNFRSWNNEWAFHASSPGLLVDGLTIRSCNYGVWRCVHDRHCFRGLTIVDTHKPEYLPKGTRDPVSSFPASISDTQPPATVVTRVVRRPDGGVTLTGTSTDDGVVTRVVVDGKDARSLRGDFSEWQIELPASADRRTVSAHAVDAAGNVEPSPHVVRVGRSGD